MRWDFGVWTEDMPGDFASQKGKLVIWLDDRNMDVRERPGQARGDSLPWKNHPILARKVRITLNALADIVGIVPAKPIRVTLRPDMEINNPGHAWQDTAGYYIALNSQWYGDDAKPFFVSLDTARNSLWGTLAHEYTHICQYSLVGDNGQKKFYNRARWDTDLKDFVRDYSGVPVSAMVVYENRPWEIEARYCEHRLGPLCQKVYDGASNTEQAFNSQEAYEARASIYWNTWVGAQ